MFIATPPGIRVIRPGTSEPTRIAEGARPMISHRTEPMQRMVGVVMCYGMNCPAAEVNRLCVGWVFQTFHGKKGRAPCVVTNPQLIYEQRSHKGSRSQLGAHLSGFKSMRRFIDRTIGRWTRHFFFICVRSYYGLFYNVGVSGKHLLQAEPGSLILATHVSRHDGPMISALLYSTVRVRPTVHWDEYHHPAQRLPMWVVSAIPMSSPKNWAPERRTAQKDKTLRIIRRVLDNENAVLLFPAGRIRQQPEEVVAPYLNGVREILAAQPDRPVLLLRTEGLGRFQEAQYDRFWTFLGRKKGRRHVNMTLSPVTDLDPTQEKETFNASLEAMLNEPVTR